MTDRVKKACDACRRRRVRCNGELRCQQCTHLNLKCNYTTPNPGVKSRRGSSRGHIVSLFKEKETRNEPRILAPSPSSTSTVTSAARKWHPPTPQTPATPISLGQGIGDEAAFFGRLADDYEEFVFAFFPIITKRELLEAIQDMNSSRETRAFVHATAAITINMRVNQRRHCDYDIVRSQVLFLVTRGLEIRGAMMPYQRPNVQTIMLSTFVHVCLFAHHVNDDMAFFYLREAITNLQILDVDGVGGAVNSDRPRLQRLYWLLFIHERFASLRFYRVPILSPLSSIPASDGTLEPGIEQWYTAIIQRFCMLDDTFIANWINKGNPSAPECDTGGTDWSWIEAKQAQLSAEMDLHTHPSPILTEMQQVDIIITSYWVRTLLWQIALSICLLTSDSSSDWMSLSFPLRLSHQLQSLLTLISRDSIEVHGAGILQKIFDITSTIADILIHVTPLTPRADTEAHIADFFFLYDYLNNMSKFFEAERKLLQEKRERIRAIFSR